MRRSLAVCASLATALAVLVAGSGAADVSSKKKVSLGDNFFDPKKISISSGTKVAFDWAGDHKHNVTKLSGPGGGFASATTRSNGVNFTKKFSKTGKYKLICSVHEKMKMTVKVG